MTYRTPENLIRSIMAGQGLNESHAPALKIPETDRVADALKVLHANGIESAAKQDENTITINAEQINRAADIMDRAVMQGLMAAKPQFVSAEAIPVPEHRPEPIAVKSEPTPPDNGHKLGEEAVEESVVVRDEDQPEQTVGIVNDDATNVTLVKRSLVNRTENQRKKIDEEEQIDEISKPTVMRYVAKAAKSRDAHSDNSDHHTSAKYDAADHGDVSAHDYHSNKAEKHDRSANNRAKGISKAIKRLAKEETDLQELSYGKLKAYTKAGAEQIAKSNKIDGRIEKRKAGLAVARSKKVEKVSKAAFGESTVTPVDTVLRVLAESKGLRLVATHNSDCGKHSAKVYKDSEWGEHRVRYFIHGKHHEPGDSHHGDVDDAHGTARAELKRLTKLNGALKEATQEEIDSLMEGFEQIDELSKATISKHIELSKVLAKEAAEDGELPFQAESVNQIDEISNQTLIDYVSKASRSADTHHMKGNYEKSKKRSKNIDKAFNKLEAPEGRKDRSVREEAEQIDELSKDTLKSYTKKANTSFNKHVKKAINHQQKHEYADDRDERNHHAGEWFKHNEKSHKRAEGILRAEKKLREEAEQLDELGSGTLTRYSIKAASSVRKHEIAARDASREAQKHDDAGDSRSAIAADHKVEKHFHKTNNRLRGIHRSNRKIANSPHPAGVHEEAEQIDEVSKDKLKKYVSKATASARAHDHMQDMHQNLAKHQHDDADMEAKKHMWKADDRRQHIDKAKKKLREEVELSEGKKEDVEKAKKHLFKHPEANAIGQSIHSAAKHFNYVQDACDHVFNNHAKDLSYEDYDKMKPHLENTFKEHGLK